MNKKLKLELHNPDSSHVAFKITRFPDGQQDVTITDENIVVDSSSEVEIVSRFRSFQDLELIICATKALRRMGVRSIHLNIPYILGARSDRQFVPGGTSYLVDVIAPIINAQGYETVKCVDAHSDVAAACINNLKVADNFSTVHSAMCRLVHLAGDNPIIFVSPDGGSLKKIYKVIEKLTKTVLLHDPDPEVIVCSKSRDEKGKLTKMVVPIKATIPAHYVIIDDICDGGRTFTNIAQEIRSTYTKNGELHKPVIHLIVTHGIFSQGLDPLFESIDHVYCSNSYSNFPSPEGKKGTFQQIQTI